jgi:hypothetical protein
MMQGLKQRAVKTGRAVVLIFSMVFLAACTNTFLYNQLDWMIPWYVDDFVDLTRPQKKNLKVELQTLLRWHQGEELSSYIVIIDRIEADLQQPLAAETVQSWADMALAAWERLEERMMPLVFDLGADLSDEQIQGFIDKLWEQQTEFEEEYLGRDDAEYVEDAYEDFEENIEEFLGRLSPEQKDVIQLSAQSLQRFDTLWLEDRSAWLEELQGYLRREPGWEMAIQEAVKAREQDLGSAYNQAYLHNQTVINNALAAVLNLRSEKQSAKLQRALDGFRKDLNTLMERGNYVEPVTSPAN